MFSGKQYLISKYSWDNLSQFSAAGHSGTDLDHCILYNFKCVSEHTSLMHDLALLSN